MEKGIFECNIGALPKGCRKHERERPRSLYFDSKCLRQEEAPRKDPPLLGHVDWYLFNKMYVLGMPYLLQE